MGHFTDRGKHQKIARRYMWEREAIWELSGNGTNKQKPSYSAPPGRSFRGKLSQPWEHSFHMPVKPRKAEVLPEFLKTLV